MLVIFVIVIFLEWHTAFIHTFLDYDCCCDRYTNDVSFVFFVESADISMMMQVAFAIIIST